MAWCSGMHGKSTKSLGGGTVIDLNYTRTVRNWKHVVQNQNNRLMQSGSKCKFTCVEALTKKGLFKLG